MFLTCDETNTDAMLINLQRLEYGSGPNSVLVDWLMTLISKDEKQYHAWKEQKKHFIMTQLRGHILRKKIITEHLVPPFDTDTFYIRLQLFVILEIVDEKYALFDNDYHLRELQSFIEIHAGGKDTDIEISNKSMKINAHKEVLSFGSLYFKNNICPGTEWLMLWKDRKAFARIIAYLYSGDLKYVLSRPNSLLRSCITELGIEEVLEQHYLPNILKLRTGLDVNCGELEWEIDDFSKIEDGTVIRPKDFNDFGPERSWQLEFQIRVVRMSMRMSISVECKARGNPILAHVQIIPITLKPNRRRWFRFTNFIQEEMLMNQEKFFKIKKSEIQSLLPGDKLSIIFRIQILLSERVFRRNH